MLRWTVHLRGGPDRAEHATVAVGSKVYAFGSHTVAGMAYMHNTGQFVTPTDAVNVSVFNTVSLRWTKLLPTARPPPSSSFLAASATKEGGGEKREPLQGGGGSGDAAVDAPAAAPPSRRWGHTAVLIGGVAYLWGGYNYFTKEYYDALHAFDVDAHRWLPLATTSPAAAGGTGGTAPAASSWRPEARHQHSACALADRDVMLVYGGRNRLTAFGLGDVARLDTRAMAWSRIAARGAPPPAPPPPPVGAGAGGGGGGVGGHLSAACVIGTRVLEFGGAAGGGGGGPQRGHSNAVRAFDADSNAWTTLAAAAQQQHQRGPLPEAREGHAAFAHDGAMYVFGGRDAQRDFHDVWRFDVKAASWKEVAPRGAPGPAWRPSMCCCAVGDRVVLFGGSKGGGAAASADHLHILDLSPSLKTLSKMAVIHHGLKHVGLPHNVRWELAAMTTTT